MKKAALILGVLLATNVFAYDGTPQQQVDAFFSDLERDSGRAVDQLYASNPIMKHKAQELTIMKGHLSQTASLFGDYLGYETVVAEQLSPSLVRLSVLEKRELHPITWAFYFYKPKDHWIISQAVFVDNFHGIGSRK